MFENRSFDNLLGRLYQPGEVQAFEGVLGKQLTNPIPEWAEDGADRKIVPYAVATNMNTPNPDSGEEYPHINTQLFGIVDPPANRLKPVKDVVAPYNAPATSGQQPTMDGFVADYISAFTAEMRRQPRYDEYAQIMTGYTPEQLPVLSTLARGFATFDHWFCEVPSQTFTNRSFFHAATASGYVDNSPPASAFPVHNTAETIFERLEAQGLTWRVYCDPPSEASFTGLIHAARLRPRFATNFFTTDQFLEDAAQGRLPTYAFIEPNLWHGHNDMHPPVPVPPGVGFNPPSPLLGGEALLAKIYNAIRQSSSPGGSNYLNTLLLVTFDEHGGTYDHVPPPPAPPPDPAAPAGQMGFRFDRSGVRLPTLAISAWIPERTVVNDEYRHTSLIRTLRERWSLGSPLTARDAAARDLAPIFTRDAPRAPESWPDVFPQPVPAFNQALLPPDAPLSVLAKHILLAVLAFAKEQGETVPDVAEDADIRGAEAVAILHEVAGKMFPGLQSGSAAFRAAAIPRI
jgi:phospholipase C